MKAFAWLPVLVSILLCSPLNGDAAAGESRAIHERAVNKPKKDACREFAKRGGNPKKACLGGSSSGIAKADFNGDGFADLAVGVPGEETPAGVPFAGAVIVTYGSPAGLTATDADLPAPQFWSQNSPGVPDASERDDFFGSALAGGDFNDDGFSDLAIGAPGENLESEEDEGDTGAVTVIYGSAGGLATTGTTAPAPRLFHVQSFGIFFFFAEDAFGSALAWGDFDADGVGDLAIGAHRLLGEDPLDPRSGEVFVLYGTRTSGLSLLRKQFWSQESQGVPGSGAEGDSFGQALAAGDFDNNGATDLAIGIPLKEVAGEDTQGNATIVDAGAVLVLFGAPGTGLRSLNVQLFDATDLFRRARPGNVALAGDQFGAALASGDFDGDSRDDLAIGVPTRDIGPLTNAGGVFVAHSNSSLPLAGTIQFWEQTALFGSNLGNQNGSPTERFDLFGAALAAGDFNSDRRDDLAIGVPFEDVLMNRGGGVFENITDAGSVNVIYGSGAGLSVAGRAPQQWHQDTINVENAAETGDRFGSSLTAWSFGRNETRQICTGVPPICLDVPFVTADLAVGVPFEDIGTIRDAGAVNVLYGTIGAPNGLTSFGDQFWTQNSPGVPGASQASDQFGAGLY